MPAVRQALHRTKLCATRLRIRTPVNSHKAAPRVMANTTDALIGAIARKSPKLPAGLTDCHVLRVVEGRRGVVTLLRRLQSGVYAQVKEEDS